MLRMAIDEPKPLHLLSPKTVDEAVAMGTEHWPDAAYLAGGCDLLDQMKHQWHNPRTVINLKGVASLKGVHQASGTFFIGALTRLGEIERNDELRKRLPALVLAASRIATPQIRNRGTVGGNLLQDSRCPYYRGAWYCYRAGGIVCDAKHGINKEHAIFGGDRCYTVTPSDLAPVVVALDARIHIQEANHPADIPAQALFLSPSYDITHMHMLNQGQILTAVEIPLRADQRSTFIKYAPRNAWDFSRASVAVAFSQQGGVCRNCRIVLGGVAVIPWRSSDAEAIVEGQRLTPQVIEAAAAAATTGAVPLQYNGYKVALVRRLVRQALTQLAA
jgi:xanthine dehydrogenase YagS FAD-binding subunit